MSLRMLTFYNEHTDDKPRGSHQVKLVAVLDPAGLLVLKP